jgi:hypothetical protein
MLSSSSAQYNWEHYQLFGTRMLECFVLSEGGLLSGYLFVSLRLNSGDQVISPTTYFTNFYWVCLQIMKRDYELSVCLSVHMEQLCSHWMDVHKI